MKKLLSLLMLLTFAGVGNVWAEGSFSLVQDNTIAFTPGTADNTSVENLTFTIGANETWTTQSRTYNSYTKSAKKGTVSLTNNVPTAGTFLTFTPSQNGKISVDIYWGTQNKTINAYDAANPSVSIASQSVGDTKESQTFTFDVEANKTYYVYAAGTGALEIFGFTYTPDSEGANAVMIAVEDMRYAAQKSAASLTRTIRDFTFTYGGDIISYESGGVYTLLVRDAGSITITSNDENVKIRQVALYSADVSAENRGDFKYYSVTEGNNTVNYLLYTNASGTNSVTFTNGTNQNFNIYNIWIDADNAISRTKQDVELSYSPAIGSATVNTSDYSISEITTTPTAFRVDSYSVSNDGGTGTTYNTYHGSTNKASVNAGTSNGVATIQATFAGNDYFNAATPADYKLVITGESKTSWDFTVSEEIDTLNLKADANWSYNSKYKYYDCSGHDPSSSALTANGVPLLYSDGLIFYGNIYIFPDNCIRLTNNGRTITIPNVTENKYVAVTFRSTNNQNSRGFTASGSGSGTYNTIAQKTVYVQATSTGDFTITSNSGIEILKLAIVDEVPHETMFTMTTPASTTEASTSTDIVLTADRVVEIIGGASTVNLTVNGTTVVFTFNATNNTLTCDNATLTAAIGALTNSTSYTITLPADVIQVEGGAKNSAQNFAFATAEAAAALIPEYNRTWTFDEFETTSIKSTVLENNMELVGDDTHDMTIGSSSKTYDGVRYTHRLQFKDAGTSSYRYIHFKVANGSKISVWGVSAKSSEARAIKIATGTFDNVVASTNFTDEMATLETSSSTTSETDVWIYAGSGVNIYGVKVWSDLPALTRFSPKGNQYTELDKSGGRTTWPDYTIFYTPTEANITSEQLSISSSDASVLDVSQVTYDLTTPGTILVKNMKMGEGGTATITLDYTGGTYASASTDFTLTVIAPGQFRVQLADQQIQQGQRTVVTPIITDKYGNQLGIKNDGGTYSTYILGEDDDTPDYTQYFDFSYSVGEGTGTNYNYINVDGNGNVTTKSGDNIAAVGATRVINVTGTVKEGFVSLFTNSSISGSGTMTIVAAAERLEVEFFFDAACINEHKIVNNVHNRVEGNTGIFGDDKAFPDGFPNGRMIYVKPTNEGDEIWFSYAKNAAAATLTSDHKIDKNKRIFQYRRGIPIYINETLQDGDYISVNAVAMYKNESGKWQLRGGVAKMKFIMTDFTRPNKPTYDPISPSSTASDNNGNRRIMDTSENVVAYGEGASKTTEGIGNLVYGKFSTSSVYKIEQLINEETVSSGTNSVPVVSTEVNKRRFTAVQIKTITSDANYGYGEYISDTTYTEYYYLYDTRLALTPAGNQYINVNTSSTAPETSVKWYNKVAPGWQDVTTKTVTFSIVNRNGAGEADVNESTGVISAGANTGWVRVKAYYAGGEDHGDVDGEPQYKSQTAPSEAYFYVYISDPTKEEPEITPPSRNFTSTQTYKVKAPADWDVRYTTDGTEPSATNGTYLKKNTTVEGVATATTTVKAIAYNPNATSNVSRIVSETYTKVDPLPDPVFNPDGVPSPYYYNTNSLTVQIACAYAGSVIYYTVDGSTPEIGAEGTYKYSGLEKVTISGNVAIKAIAHDPDRDIYSHVVTSNYIYSTEMLKPYFQILDEGKWYGYDTNGDWSENGTAWNNGQTHTVTPTTQIRIGDPNPVPGEIYFTVDGSTPNAESVNSYKYSTPFTVAKTTTGSSITFLDEASSQVATAIFEIDNSTYPVWEAVEQTTPGGIMSKTDGFIISTNENLNVTNTGTKVNLNSLDGTHTGGTASYTYAQPYITATFGGFDLKNWTYMTIADDAIGLPLGNVGEYTIKNNETNNARDEYDKAYYHVYTYKKDPTKAKGSDNQISTHEKTFHLPAMGSYVRFEPEKDGDLTIWALQQGSLLYEEDKWFVPNVLRLRPVYLIDEQGNSIPVKVVNGEPQMWSSARLSEKWTQIQATAASNGWKNSAYDSTKKEMIDNDAYAQWIRKSDGVIFQEEPSDYTADKYKRIVNKGPNTTETAAIYNMYNTYLTTNGINIGDPIKPIAIHDGTTIRLNAGSFIEDSNDGTGYVMLTGGYTKYTFPVKAGKTYFFTAQATKIGIRGFQFVPTETASRTSLTIEADGTSSINYGNLNTTEALTVTLKRAFKANTWAALVLPFSVSQTQLAKAFGDGVDVLHFDDITNNGGNIHLVRHWYKMLVAGTPVLIRPTEAIDATTGVTFDGVRMEAETVETITGTDDSYSFMGTLQYNATGIQQYDYYINSKGNFSQWKNSTATPIKATRAWLRPKNAVVGAKQLTTDFSDFFDEGTITGIINIENDENTNGTMAFDGKIYNLKGQVVSYDGDTSKLPKGVYISNGEKFVIK